MYKFCTRCNFKVPENKQICHICGNSRLKAKAIAISSEPTTVVADKMVQAPDLLKEQIYHWIRQVQLSVAELAKRKERTVKVTEAPFDFLAVYKDTHLRVSAVDCINSQTKNPVIAEFVPHTNCDTETLNAHIEEVVQWFKEYGREGLLTSKGRTEEPLRLSDAA